MALEEAVRRVQDFNSLLGLLRDELKWDINLSSPTIEDVTYEWTANELRLSESTSRRLQDGVVRQLRPFSKNSHQPWGIFFLEFNNGQIYHTALRQVLRKLVPSRRRAAHLPAWQQDNLLFICTTRNCDRFTFAHFRGQEVNHALLSTFGWERDDTHFRTLCEYNLNALRFPDDGGTDHNGWTNQWHSAWDVEKVTQRFFDDYRETFTQVETAVKGMPKGEQRRIFTQTLFNRLMFCAFLQKKGWLDGKRSYLRTLLQDACGNNSHLHFSKLNNFYNNFLHPLFFKALSVSHTTRKNNTEWPTLFKRIGNVPFLNGGLFEPHQEYGQPNAITIPNSAFASIFDLFDRYNFTVAESTPLNIEVAVDPEMLGRVFEELVTDRHEKGSYYTPRNVVAFMCREALKGYLSGIFGNGKASIPDSIAVFVDENDPSGLSDPEAVLDALKRIRVCDPACGSGAYLLGMMQELLRLRESLFTSKVKDHAKIYDRKLEIIQRNLYGADNDPFAVNIAMLRLWLSLVVDDERDPLNDPRVDVSLPNLKFKIQVGDSLTAPNPDPSRFVLQRDAYASDAAKLNVLHNKYFSLARGNGNREKVEIERDIEKTKIEIAKLFQDDTPKDALDWRLAFPEVFSPSIQQSSNVMQQPGFDIVLANPPYIRADAKFIHPSNDEDARQKAIAQWKGYRTALLNSGIYQTLYEKWDLYLPFLERAHQLMCKDGHMVLIVSDAYNAAKYARKSQEFFLKHARIERIDFCSDICLFKAGVNNTILHFSKSTPDAIYHPSRIRRWGKKHDEFELNAEILPTTSQTKFGTKIFRQDDQQIEKFVQGYVPLDEICFISVGMVINSNERKHQGAFKANDLFSDHIDTKHPKQFVFGKDVARWYFRNRRFLEWGTRRAPAQFRRPTFPELHDAKEKLIAVRTPGPEPKVMYDSGCLHFDASSIGFIPWYCLKGIVNNSIKKTAKYRRQDPEGDREEREEISKNFHIKYLLAVMNSAFAKKWLATQRRSKRHIYPDDWKHLPIAPIPITQQQEFVKRVDAIQAEFNQHGYPLPQAAAQCVAQLEREIDGRVATLYSQEAQ